MWTEYQPAYMESLEKLLCAPPDVLVVYEGPDVPHLRLRGHGAIRQLLENARHTRLLVIVDAETLARPAWTGGRMVTS